LAGEHQVHPSQITQWKKQLLEAAQELFSDRRGQDRQQQEELIAQLYQQIGQLKVEVDFLKKKLWSN
jgi:putative transposase